MASGTTTESAWEQAHIVQAGTAWALVCNGPGGVCTTARLAKASHSTPSHDDRLAACTESINRILERVAAENEGPGRCLRFLVTPYGRMLAWTRCDDQGQLPADLGITLENDPAGFAGALGLSVESQRATGPLRDWVLDEEGNLICCRRGPNTQGVATLLRPENPSAIHDATLVECTDQINALLDACAVGNTDPRVSLALLSTPPGLFLAWTVNDDSGQPNPPGAITPLSPPDKIYKALGLAKPGGGGPPWKVIIPVAAAGALAGILIIVIAAVIFSGGDSSDGDGTPTPTTSPTATETIEATETPEATEEPSPTTEVEATDTAEPTEAEATSTSAPAATETPDGGGLPQP